MSYKHCIMFGNNRYYTDQEKQDLYQALENEIKNGTKLFSVGVHGRFDVVALWLCKKLRNIYPDIKVRVVFSNLNFLKKPNSPRTKELLEYYEDAEIFTYPIENIHYKAQIVATNKFMVDDSTSIICNIDTDKHYGGAIQTYKYAKRKNKNVINLYTKNDE